MNKVDARMKTVVVVGTMDTKTKQMLFVKELIEKAGHRCLIMDIGTRAPSPVPVSVSSDEVALAAGATVESIREMKELRKIIPLMIDGAATKAGELLATGTARRHALSRRLGSCHHSDSRDETLAFRDSQAHGLVGGRDAGLCLDMVWDRRHNDDEHPGRPCRHERDGEERPYPSGWFDLRDGGAHAHQLPTDPSLEEGQEPHRYDGGRLVRALRILRT